MAYRRNVDKESVISGEPDKYSAPSEYVGRSVRVKKKNDTDSKDKIEMARHQRTHGSDKWQHDLQHYLEALRYKAGTVRSSVSLKQFPANLQEMFNRFFKDAPKQFTDLLVWAGLTTILSRTSARPSRSQG